MTKSEKFGAWLGSIVAATDPRALRVIAWAVLAALIVGVGALYWSEVSSGHGYRLIVPVLFAIAAAVRSGGKRPDPNG